MDLCIHRTTQRQHKGDFSFCRQKQRPCRSLRQLICTAPDIWPAWVIVLGAAIVAGLTIAALLRSHL